jgi:hypothetical protein
MWWQIRMTVLKPALPKKAMDSWGVSTLALFVFKGSSY